MATQHSATDAVERAARLIADQRPGTVITVTYPANAGKRRVIKVKRVDVQPKSCKK